MRGTSRSTEAHMLLYVTERMIAKQEIFMEFCEEQFLKLTGDKITPVGSRPSSAPYKKRKPSRVEDAPLSPDRSSLQQRFRRASLATLSSIGNPPWGEGAPLSPANQHRRSVS